MIRHNKGAAFIAKQNIFVKFVEGDDFMCEFQTDDEHTGFVCDFGEGFEQYQRAHPIYSGTYEVTPTAYEQNLETTDKLLEQDVIIHSTPYSEVSNEDGGYTITIL